MPKIVWNTSFMPLLVFLLICFHLALNEEQDEPKKKKDIRDYNDVDIERLYDQWEEADEDELEEDELPEYKRQPPKVDMSQLDPSNPEQFLKMSKKGQTLMMFVSVSGNPSRDETEEITKLWHTSLFNAHYDCQRFVVDDNRVIFMVKDGSVAWEVKDFLVKQDRCQDVTIEQKVYPGRGAPAGVENNDGEKLTKGKQETATNNANASKKKKKKKEEL